MRGRLKPALPDDPELALYELLPTSATLHLATGGLGERSSLNEQDGEQIKVMLVRYGRANDAGHFVDVRQCGLAFDLLNDDDSFLTILVHGEGRGPTDSE